MSSYATTCATSTTTSSGSSSASTPSEHSYRTHRPSTPPWSPSSKTTRCGRSPRPASLTVRLPASPSCHGRHRPHPVPPLQKTTLAVVNEAPVLKSTLGRGTPSTRRGDYDCPATGHGKRIREDPPSPCEIVRRDGVSSVLVAGSFVGAEVPGVARMGTPGHLQADASSGCEAMSQCVEPNLDGSVGLLRLEPAEPIAHIDRASLGTHVTQSDEQIGVRIIGVVHQLDDGNPDHLEGFAEHRRGEGQDVVPLLELPVVAVTACCRIDHAPAD